MTGNTSVVLTGIPASGPHGANPGERDAPQAFVVDVRLEVAVGGDRLAATLDYRVAGDLVRTTVAETSFVLLESLAEAVAVALAGLDPVREATVTVHKPAAARSLGVTGVSATFTARR